MRYFFTLIELFIVILVIGILMSMLLPFLMKVKRKSQQINCASNIKQMGLSYHTYLSDHDLIFPSSYTNGKRYGCWVNKYDKISSNIDGVLWSYVEDWRVYYCSADREHNYRSYSINGRMCGERVSTSYGGGRRLGVIKRSTSDILHFIEESDPRGYNMNSFYINRPSFYTWRNCDYAGSFHGKFYNVSFLDGHLSSYRLFWEESYIASTCGYVGYRISSGNPDAIWLYGTQRLY